MGGKSRLFDPKLLESLYLASRRFNQQAEGGMHVIQSELAKINEFSLQNRLIAGHGEADKESVSSLNDAIGSLKQTLASTNKFIEIRLAGAAQLAQDKHAKYAASESKAIPMDWNLKK